MAEVIRARFGESGPRGDSPEVLSVACLNLSPEPGMVERNLRLAEREVRGAIGRHADTRWVVLPELFTSAYSGLEEAHLYAENATEGESARRFVTLARELGVYIAYGFPERRAGFTGVYDSANLVGPEGVLLTYRKRHLVLTTPEPQAFSAGDELAVVEAGGLRVGIVICWDLGFPEVAREAATLGAQLVLAPCGWRDPWGPQYEISLQARALDSGIFVASANQLGHYPEARFSSPGHVYGPDGLRTSRAERRGVRCVAALDPESPARWRRLYGSTLAEPAEELPLLGQPAV